MAQPSYVDLLSQVLALAGYAEGTIADRMRKYYEDVVYNDPIDITNQLGGKQDFLIVYYDYVNEVWPARPVLDDPDAMIIWASTKGVITDPAKFPTTLAPDGDEWWVTPGQAVA